MRYCERCGGKFDFEGICETCGCDEEWSWNYPENRNKVTCKGCENEIYEVRRYCHICGARNAEAFKKGDYYCPKCGLAFENGVCPECGKELSDFQLRDYEPEERRYCSVCGKEVYYRDNFCMHCGNANYRNPPLKDSPAKKPKNSGYGDKYTQSNKETLKRAANNTGGQTPDHSNYPNTTLWIVLGVLSAFFCCILTGIMTAVYAGKASGDVSAGLIHSANKNIAKAKKWFAAGIILNIIGMIISFILSLFMY